MPYCITHSLIWISVICVVFWMSKRVKERFTSMKSAALNYDSTKFPAIFLHGGIFWFWSRTRKFHFFCTLFPKRIPHKRGGGAIQRRALPLYHLPSFPFSFAFLEADICDRAAASQRPSRMIVQVSISLVHRWLRKNNNPPPSSPK